MAGRFSSFTGIAAIAGLLATLVSHLGPATRSARVVIDEAGPAIWQAAEHGPHVFQAVDQATHRNETEPARSTRISPPPRSGLSSTLTPPVLVLPSNPVHADLQRALAEEEAQRAASVPEQAPPSSPQPSVPIAVNQAPMSVVEMRRCLDFKEAIAAAADQTVSAKISLNRERALLLARDTEVSAALADDTGDDPGEHLSVQIQSDELRADVAAHNRKSVEARRLADTAYDLQDRYNRTCTGRKYSADTYQAALALQPLAKAGLSQ